MRTPRLPSSPLERAQLRERLLAAGEVPYDLTLKMARKLVADHPDATPPQLVELENARYLRRVSAESGAVGAAAAYPGFGTATAAGLTGGQLVAFVGETAAHALIVAHLHGLDLRDPAKRNALVLAALTGKAGADIATAELGVTSLAWFRSAFITVRTARARKVNQLMVKWLTKAAARRYAVSGLGRLAPFGIGAAVGWSLGRSMGREVNRSLETALGPAPAVRPTPVVVDITVEDVQSMGGVHATHREDDIVAEIDEGDGHLSPTQNLG